MQAPFFAFHQIVSLLILSQFLSLLSLFIRIFRFLGSAEVDNNTDVLRFALAFLFLFPSPPLGTVQAS